MFRMRRGRGDAEDRVAEKEAYEDSLWSLAEQGSNAGNDRCGCETVSTEAENTRRSEAVTETEGDDRIGFLKALRGLVLELAVLAAAIIVIFTVFFGITIQQGNDMYPALRDGDVILYYRTDDLINTEPCVYTAAGETHTGRVAATSGTNIGATGDLQLTFDGIYLPASAGDGIYSRTYAADGEPLPVTIKEGYYFMLGDNRESAKDSRVYGQISCKNVRGRIVTVLRRRQI